MGRLGRADSLSPDDTDGGPSSLQAAVRGTCPRCGVGGMFGSVVGFAPRCAKCGLDFSQFNVGDGPAAFLILIVGTVLTVGALVVDGAFEPSMWVHLIWLPLGLGLTLGGLRLAKGFLLAQEYRTAAREGRIVG